MPAALTINPRRRLLDRAALCRIRRRVDLAVLETPQPYPAFVAVTRKLFGKPAPAHLAVSAQAGRAASAQIDPTARLEAGVIVDPLAVIGAARRDRNSATLIGPGAVIGSGRSHRPRNAPIGAHASILHALIGDRVIIHPGVRIGQDGNRLFAVADGAIKRFRRRAAPSFRTTSRSAPIATASTAAPPAIPSLAKAPRSTISCKSDTTFRSAGTA